MRPDGCLYHLGRKDLQVKIRGYRIEIGEVESALEAIEQVKEAAVVKMEIAGSGEENLVAYVVPKRNPAPTVASLRDALGKKLPSYMQPSRFVFLDALPLAPNGKIDRDALPPAPVSRPDVGAPLVPPRTPIETTLTQVWADVLELDCVGIHDNFFDLGGHSLAAARLVSHLLSHFRLQLSVESLLQAPTVAQLAAVIAERQAKQPGHRPERSELTEALAPVSRDRKVPLSFSQQRLWFLHQFEPQSPIYNEPKAFRLKGSLDIAALQAAVNALVGRHRVLRSVYFAVDGSPAQLVLENWSVELAQIDLRERLAPQRAKELDQVLKEVTHRPFDLGRDLMLRAVLIRLAHDEHVLLLVTHHIASDGWSSSILFQELSALYAAFSQSQPSPLTDLPIQYADYAIRQRDRFKGEYLEEEASYWRKQLENISPLELPTDRSRPAVQSHRGRKQRFTLPIELAGGLKSLSRQESATLFMTLLAAFQILLHRYSGQEDIAVGSPIAGRDQLELEGLIGFFINTLVLRNDLSGDPTFPELLRRVRSNALRAYSHQGLPFEKLVEELQPERNLSRNPLFQVVFQLRNYPDASVKLANLTVEEIDFDSGIAKFDLSLAMRDRPTGLEGTLEYSEDLFDGSTISRMIGHFQKLLQEIRSNPERRISELPILTDSERNRLLVEWNGTQTDDPGNKCIHELFAAQAELAPDAVALVCAGEQLTYRELSSRANQLARHLRKIGVGPEVSVGICLERSLEMVVGLLAILKAGGAYVPLDPVYPKERLVFMLNNANAKVLLTQRRVFERLSGASIQNPKSKIQNRTVLCLDADWPVIARESEENLSNRAMPENTAYVIYTSGSTGKPKGVSIEHRQIVNYARAIVDRCNLDPHARFAMVQPLSVDSSQTVIFPALISGGCLDIIPEDQAADPQALSRYFSRFPIDVLKIAPSHLAALQDSPHPEQLLPRRRLIIGGEASRWDWIEKLQSMAGDCAVFNHYGPTETTVGVLTYRVPKNALDRGGSTVPLGRPLPNTQVYVLDTNLQPVPIGVPGELRIGGRCLARGYLDRPEATAEKFVPNPFGNEPGSRLYKTGDVGRYLSDGNIEFLGRTDHQVKIRGFRIEPGEIESALAQHPAVREAVVVAREDARAE
ncbi:MAG: amino acid adenylation domain-containing protein, partial [Candidatus Binatia bacterium]